MNYRDLQSRIAALSDENIADTIAYINENLNAKTVRYLGEVVFAILPTRPLQFPLFTRLLTELEKLKAKELRDPFMLYILSRMREPNQSEVCAFVPHLVESGFMSAEEYLICMINIFRNYAMMTNIEVIQHFYGMWKIAKILEAENATIFTNVLNVFEQRKRHIEDGSAVDHNAEFYLEIYQRFLELKANKWEVSDTDKWYKCLQCLEKDDVKGLEALHDVDFNDLLEPTLFACSSVASFSAPIPCVAAFYGAINCVKWLKSKGVSLAERDSEERTIAQFAAASGNIELLAYLKEEGLPFELAPAYAVEFWREDAFKWLNEHVYPDISKSEEEGQTTTLHAAAKVNNVKALELLAAAGMSVAIRDEYRWTPMHVAAANNSYEALKILLGMKDADPNVKDMEGDSPLHCAAKEGALESVDVLLAAPGINVNQNNTNFAKPLHWACTANAAAVVARLLQNPGVEINAKDLMERTPLFAAVVRHSVDAVRVMLGQKGLEINNRDRTGNTVLSAAAAIGDVELVRMIASYPGVSINMAGEQNHKPIVLAALCGHAEVVAFMKTLDGINLSDFRLKQLRAVIPPHVLPIIDAK